MSAWTRWKQRKHNRADINCVHHDGQRYGGMCRPCAITGGYVAIRHAQIDAERARADALRAAHFDKETS